MNQEKIMKAKMLTAFCIAFTAVLAALVFAGLYASKSKEIRQTYITQYEQNLKEASDEIEQYLQKGTDYEQHYRMVLSDLGAARTLVFLIEDYTEQQIVINELHYCFVKYPEQMAGKLEETSQALQDITDHLEKGYDEAEELMETIDYMGS